MVFAGFETLGGEGFEGVVMDGAKCESAGGGFATLPGGRRNILPLTVEVSEHEVIQEEAQNASLAMRFSSQRMAAVYHSFGASSEGHPLVKQAM